MRKICRRYVKERPGPRLSLLIHSVCRPCSSYKYAACEIRIGVEVQTEFNRIIEFAIKSSASRSEHGSSMRKSCCAFRSVPPEL